MRLRDILAQLGFKDFNILKYEKHVDQESTIKVKAIDKSTTVNINLPAIELTNEMLPEADKILEAKAGFVREDLLLPEVGMLATAGKSRKLLNEFRDCVESDHFRAMIAAASVVHWEDIGEHEVAEKTFIGLNKKFPGDGRKIYNFHRSGYLEGYFLAELAMMKFQATKDARYQETFREFFKKHLEYFPFAIWSNEFTSMGDIRLALDRRFKQDDVATVRVYGRGEESLLKVEDICDAYSNVNSGLVIIFNKEYYKIGRQRACCVTMNRKGAAVHEPRDGASRQP